jgi:putative hydrolase of the HAD superfamily/pyrimidine and pyridine-specific 5'-nucleotidase
MAPAPIECVFFDCDDCLYKDDWKTMRLLTAKISQYTSTELSLPGDVVYELFKKHGTTLCGLVKEGHLQEDQVDEFLEKVHDVPLDFGPDPQLRSILAAIPYPRWVFTASVPSHAERCLKRLGIEDMFRGIISASSREMIDKVGYVSKHDPRCFAAAMDIAGVPKEKAAGCVFFDDSVSNLRTANGMGWRTILVGLRDRDTGAPIQSSAFEGAVATLHEIPSALPDLFVVPASTASKKKKVPAPIECVFFDCDDCLYKNNWATMRALTAKIAQYTSTELNLPGDVVYGLFKKHGTTLCGLVKEGYLREDQVDEFLEKVHDVPLDFGPDPQLRPMLAAIPYPRWVFTASVPSHAKRCLKLLGIEDMFQGIISASSREMIDKVGYVSKHDPRCFSVAMETAGVPKDRAAGCVFFDDSVSNLRTANEMGWRTVLVGLHDRDTGARIASSAFDAAVASLHEIPTALPDLFVPPQPKIPKMLTGEHCHQSSKARRVRKLKPCDSAERRVVRRVSEAEAMVGA